MSDRRIEILNQRLAAAGETDLAIIDAAELARMRKDSERWEWCKRNFRGRFGHLRIEFAGEVVHADPQAAVDAAIAAEKGK